MDPTHDDAGRLAELKRRLGSTVSVCLPARDEEATVGHIVATVRRDLMEKAGVVDEILVLDDGSRDATAEAARWEGAEVYAVEDILPTLPAGAGKGNALWKSLYVARGDIICWVDADIRNFRAHFVTRLVAPLVDDPGIGFVKGYYRRPFHTDPYGGGRVTELAARPVLSALFPHLARFVQPLSGEYAGRRAVLEAVPFVEGWGVEIGLLIDLASRFGLESLTQADLGVREHRNRPLDELGAPAMAVLVTALRRAGIPAHELSSTLIRFDHEYREQLVPIETRERPPMLSVPAYRAKFERELSA